MKKISKLLAFPALALTLAPANVFAVSETASIKATIPDSLTLTLSTDNLTFNLEDTDLHTNKLVVTAKTNAASGYTISFNANNDYNDLKHSNVLVEDKIESIAEDKTEATFPETAWAYSTDISDYTFKKIPLAAENIFATTEKGENTHDFTVGVRANSLAAGNYENELIFTAVANIVENNDQGSCNPDATNINNAVCLQDMNDRVKETMYTDQQYQLKDARDGKVYFISKLKDDHVWMTQNLDYDLNTEANRTLKPETSNVLEEKTIVVEDYDSDDSLPAYLDGGDIYFNGGAAIKGTSGYSDLPSNDERRHYHIGDLYVWRIAAMGQLPTNWKNFATESICPAKWQLPFMLKKDGDGSYEELFEQYNMEDSEEVISANQILSSPFFYIMGNKSEGNVETHEMFYYGRYWTSQPFYVSGVVMALSIETTNYLDGSITDGYVTDFTGLSWLNSGTGGTSRNYVRCVAL